MSDNEIVQQKMKDIYKQIVLGTPKGCALSPSAVEKAIEVVQFFAELSIDDKFAELDIGFLPPDDIIDRHRGSVIVTGYEINICNETTRNCFANIIVNDAQMVGFQSYMKSNDGKVEIEIVISGLYFEL